jgi:acetyltransferase-like isoleucine patch superfamily enzyme
MSNKISVITVVYNDVTHIRETMESFFSQTWPEKEYIVIDGGSTDGTADIIREYADRLAYWCSEPDEGIYYAMNKGISQATGDWINILNSGDEFFSPNSLEKAIMNTPNLDEADIIYGDSVERSNENGDVYKRASDFSLMSQGPVYRHGSSLVRSSVQRQHLYATSQRAVYGYALDWLMIYTLFKKGYRFQHTKAIIQIYLLEGASFGLAQNLKYNRLVINGGKPLTMSDKIGIRKRLFREWMKGTTAYTWLIGFLTEYVLNDILPHIPSWRCRRFIMRRLKMKIGYGTFIAKRNYIITPQQLVIGHHSHINRGCTIDARGGITIGNNVSVSYNVSIMTGSHDYNNPNFRGRFLPVHIDDYVWIGNNAVIQQNITIGRGAVVCAGAVVTKDVPSFTVVAGVPARPIGQRQKELNYLCKGFMPFA